MSKDRFENSFTFAEFCRRVAVRLPELDIQDIGLYLAEVAKPPYNYGAICYWANRIETLLIREEMI